MFKSTSLLGGSDHLELLEKAGSHFTQIRVAYFVAATPIYTN